MGPDQESDLPDVICSGPYRTADGILASRSLLLGRLCGVRKLQRNP
jgi:hypothetical protein